MAAVEEVEEAKPTSVQDVPEITTADLDVEAKGAPTYKVSDVARWFLGKTSHWLRWAERRGFLTDPNGEVVGARDDPGATRVYNLRDVERVVRVLAHHGAISENHALLGLECVRIQAELHGMFEDPYEFEGRSYPLTVDEVAEIASRSPTWVRANAASLGGVRRQWDETKNQESWRFPEEGLDERIYEIMGEP